MQVAVTAVEQWSITNKLQLNSDKCEELLISFKRKQHQFDTVRTRDQPESREIVLTHGSPVVFEF